MFHNFFITPDVKEHTSVKRKLAIPTETPITLAKEMIDITTLAADKQLKSCQYNQKQQCIYSAFTHYFSFLNLWVKLVFDFIGFI